MTWFPRKTYRITLDYDPKTGTAKAHLAAPPESAESVSTATALLKMVASGDLNRILVGAVERAFSAKAGEFAADQLLPKEDDPGETLCVHPLRVFSNPKDDHE